MSDFPLMVWDMFATSPNGERVYCGSCDSEKAANAFELFAKERGFSNFEKRQVLRGNHGTTILPRMH